VTIVGSGLSVAEGVPSMGALAEHLQKKVPPKVPAGSKDSWDAISGALAVGKDLESALMEHVPSEELESIIVELTAAFILKAESKIIEEVVSGKRTLRFTHLLKYMLTPNTGIPVVTTNYDRLVEVGAEAAGLGVDALFVGHHVGKLSPKQSQYSLCRSATQRGRTVSLKYAKHAVVLKPHGSLDWYLQDDQPIRCPLPLRNQRLIITPGLNKFRGGYNPPFDTHRERANKEIDSAARYLIIGYGFNDDHLETHLEHELRGGKPAVLLTRGLSPKARQLVAACDRVLAISAPSGRKGVLVTTSSENITLSGPELWDVGEFVKEVLET
jgi:hypothetical protein